MARCPMCYSTKVTRKKRMNGSYYLVCASCEYEKRASPVDDMDW